MRFLRSERWAAVLLLCAAVVGLALANTAVGPAIIGFTRQPFGLFSLSGWVTDGLLAVFFFLATSELKHELVEGELSSLPRAVAPAAAAIGGVIVPALTYLLIARGSGLAGGWPIPTATDIAFALGVLALVGRRLPRRIRTFLLALAVLDDLIAILIIAIVFAHDLRPLYLLGAIPTLIVFALLSRVGTHWWLVGVLVVLGIATWLFVALSGIHPTVAGVALGLVLPSRSGTRVKHVLDPVSNGLILPLFAFLAAMVTVPDLAPGRLSPAFWAIVIALPLGKLVGITAGGTVALVATRRRAGGLPIGDLVVVSALGGIGFTVSLLMNQLAWRANELLVREGTLAVLCASLIAAVIGTGAVLLRSRRYPAS